MSMCVVYWGGGEKKNGPTVGATVAVYMYEKNTTNDMITT